jgi:hypothetical protein
MPAGAAQHVTRRLARASRRRSDLLQTFAAARQKTVAPTIGPRPAMPTGSLRQATSDRGGGPLFCTIGAVHPDIPMTETLTWLAAVIVAVAVFASIARRGPGRVGSAAAGAVYDLLQEDKRKALEVIVEQRAEARDPEHADGNVPDLDPTGRSDGHGRGHRRPE